MKTPLLAFTLFTTALAEVGARLPFSKTNSVGTGGIPAKLLFARQGTCPIGTRVCDGVACAGT